MGVPVNYSTAAVLDCWLGCQPRGRSGPRTSKTPQNAAVSKQASAGCCASPGSLKNSCPLRYTSGQDVVE